jgi:DNA-binding GntR family transcriptional regulator
VSQILVHRSLTERVAQAVRQQIEAGILKPKQRLTEVGLASQLGISRAPVREALRSLADRGFVVHAARKGYFVSWLTPKSLQDTYLTRRALECLAIEQIVHLGNSAPLHGVADSVRKMERAIEAGDVKAVISSDLEFHHRLVAAAGNDVCLGVYKLITSPLVPALNLLVPYELTELRQQHDQYAEEHRAILEALRRGALRDATRLLTEHLEKAMNNVLALMARSSKHYLEEPTEQTRREAAPPR